MALNSGNEVDLINCLSQASFSFSLAYELEELYGGTESKLWCFIHGAMADIEAYQLFEALDTEGGSSGHIGAIAYISLYAFADCWNN